MLRIRDEQLSAMDRELARGLAQRIVARFQAAHGGAEPTPALEAQALQAVLDAEALGIRAELDLYLYAKQQLLLGAGFEHRPGFEEARAILLDRSASWSVRLRRLDAACTRRAPRE